MVKDINTEEIVKPAATLKRAKSFYDGNLCEKVTMYEKGTRISMMEPAHQNLITKEDIA